MTTTDKTLKLIEQHSNYRLNHLAHSPRTVRNCRYALIQMATDAHTQYELRLERMSTKQLEMMLDGYAVTADTRANRITYLASFFRWLKRMDMRSDDPTVEIERPKRKGPDPRPFTEREAERAFTLCTCPKMNAWLTLAYTQGLRCQEIAELRYEWLDLDRLTMTVKGKGGKVRVLPLHPDTLEALSRYGLDYRMPDRPVFLTRQGNQYRPQTISTLMARYLKACGLNKTAHKLRHSFGTNLYQATGNLEVARAGLGHSSLQTTRHYIPSAGIAELQRAFVALPSRTARRRHLDVP